MGTWRQLYLILHNGYDREIINVQGLAKKRTVNIHAHLFVQLCETTKKDVQIIKLLF